MRSRRLYPYVPIELAAVCSAAFILLLIYLSDAGGRYTEPMGIQMPASTGFRCSIDGFGEGMILVGQGKVMLDLDNRIRRQTLINMGKKHGMQFTAAELTQFETIGVFGVPLAKLKPYLAAYKFEGAAFYAQQGIAISPQANELGDWIASANKAHVAMKERPIRMALLADYRTNSAQIKRVLDILVERKIHHVALVTDTK
ncbi:hypothetical protein [Mucilaginibacter pedocola]|uniref:Biopolymer transporter ExbD n=1 Tax=Mucilaginibacter pedocola TaxID=1792845 RepID=A0A1S9PI47_9SPHI|nr:hypothetical protein [Mucilaginibacter pedocola]OOQ60635.1 hypothetical protein BC343_23850 [Mucilaginibacter pedocola]